jgi:DNA-binding GntR family transcriptional regulator
MHRVTAISGATTDPRKWMQAADNIGQRIERGELKPGDTLSKSDFSHEFGVDVSVISRALDYLSWLGVVERVTQRRYMICDVSDRTGPTARVPLGPF